MRFDFHKDNVMCRLLLLDYWCSFFIMKYTINYCTTYIITGPVKLFGCVRVIISILSTPFAHCSGCSSVCRILLADCFQLIGIPSSFGTVSFPFEACHLV
jgi:hypothetical protein